MRKLSPTEPKIAAVARLKLLVPTVSAPVFVLLSSLVVGSFIARSSALFAPISGAAVLAKPCILADAIVTFASACLLRALSVAVIFFEQFVALLQLPVLGLAGV